MKRLSRLCLGLSAAALALPMAAHAQAYPSKPVRWITEFFAGSGGDTFLRIVTSGLTPLIGQPIVIENRPGAGGVVAAEAVARSAPDGYTLFGATPNTQVVRVHLAKSNPFDPAKDFTAITTLGEPTIIIVANPSTPYGNVKELIDYARRNPGKVSYATSGIGSSHHLSGEQIKILTGINMVHVPYKGLSESLKDVIAGQIPIGFNLSGPSAAHVKAGRIKVLAIVNPQRIALWPEVGTVNEAVAGFEKSPGWTGLFGPGGMAPALARRIAADVNKAMNLPEIKARINEAGFNVTGSTPEEFAADLKRQVALVGRIVKSAGIQPTE